MDRASSTARPDELAKFEAMADSWWDPEGAFRPLHRFNPVRIAYLRDRAAAHFGRDAQAPEPFRGLSLIDIGCGGGLIAEPMARLGFAVTGLDAADKNIGIARAHAARSGLPITYRAELAEDLAAAGEAYDVVLCLEVVEHVDDVALFLASAAALVRPGGLLIGATLNRTLKSLALAKIGAEYVLRWVPRGTHDWRRFLKPHEFVGPLQAAGLSVAPLSGVSYSPLMDTWSLSSDLSVNYLLTATRPA